MTERLPAGPYRIFDLETTAPAPYYILPFDKEGECRAPETLVALLAGAARDEFSDIFLFAHGWNNDWTDATERYEHFLTGFSRLGRERAIPQPAPYKPLLVGIFWPSTALVFGAGERGPQMAAADTELAALRDLANDLDPAEAEKLLALSSSSALDERRARDLAKLARVFLDDDDELGATRPSIDDLLYAWSEEPPEAPALDDFGTFDDPGEVDPRVAGPGNVLKSLDPRQVLRVLTVYMMKNRAGKVGARGVGPLLRGLLEQCESRVHLLGHSFGAKVVLSATCAGEAFRRRVNSMLLLQPAVSHLCFAEEVPGTGRPGGYRAAFARVEKPILSTFSRHDLPLTKIFHRALLRPGDLGEARIAAAPGFPDPPNRYAALGGFGPRNCGERLMTLPPVGEPYPGDPAVPIYGLSGDDVIGGHGDISNPATWWALHCLFPPWIPPRGHSLVGP